MSVNISGGNMLVGWLAGWRSWICILKINVRSYVLNLFYSWLLRMRISHTMINMNFDRKHLRNIYAIRRTRDRNTCGILLKQFQLRNYDGHVTFSSLFSLAFLQTKLIHFEAQCLRYYSLNTIKKSKRLCELLLWVSNCLSLFISFLLDGIVLSPSKSVYMP